MSVSPVAKCSCNPFLNLLERPKKGFRTWEKLRIKFVDMENTMGENYTRMK